MIQNDMNIKIVYCWEHIYSESYNDVLKVVNSSSNHGIETIKKLLVTDDNLNDAQYIASFVIVNG